jgi:hypothetical protein
VKLNENLQLIQDEPRHLASPTATSDQQQTCKFWREFRRWHFQDCPLLCSSSQFLGQVSPEDIRVAYATPSQALLLSPVSQRSSRYGDDDGHETRLRTHSLTP